jgi:hypothetical protein
MRVSKQVKLNDIGLIPFVPFQRPRNNETAIRDNTDEDAHEALETGRDVGYRSRPLNQRSQKAKGELGADVVDAITAILNVVTDPDPEGKHKQRREESVAQCRQAC